MRHLITILLLLAGAASISFASARNLDDVSIVLHPQDRLVLRWPDMPASRITSARLLIDFDGPENGEPKTGADWLIEGGSIFAFTSTSAGWSWDRIGSVALSYHQGETYMVLLEPSPAREGVVIIDENNFAVKAPERIPELTRVTFSMDDALPWPTENAPVPYPLDDWLETLPPALTEQTGRRITETEWSAPEYPWDRTLVINDSTNVWPLIIEVTNPKTSTVTILTNGVMSTDGEVLRWSGEAENFSWNIFFHTNSAGEVDITGHFMSEEEMPLRVRAGVYLDVSGWTWHDNLTSRRIMHATDTAHAYVTDMSREEMETSRLPLGVIHLRDSALMIAHHPDEPRAFRIEASPEQSFFGLVYDFAITPSTIKFPGQASFRCLMRGFSIEHQDTAMRQALKIYHDVFPHTYKNVIGQAPGWIPFTDAASIERPSDFGELFDVRENISKPSESHMSFRYAEPWYYWLPMPKGMAWDEAHAWDRLVLLATSGKSLPHEQAASAIAGLAHQSNGYPKPVFMETPWNRGARYEVSADPDTPVFEIGTINRAMVEARLTDEQEIIRGGVFLDSMGELTAMDFNPRARTAADFPALFDLAADKPYIGGSFAAGEWLRVLQHRLRQTNQFIIASGATRSGPFYAAMVDGFAEELFLRDENARDYLTGEKAQVTRMLAGAKPVSLGLMGDFESVDTKKLESIFRSCLLYGFIPGFHSLDGFNQIYWQNPRWYNRDRPLFQQYMPVIQRLARAGWQPMSTARCLQPEIHVEAFGPDENAHYFVLHNTGRDPINALIELPVFDFDTVIMFPLTGEMHVRNKVDTAPLSRRLASQDIDVILVAPLAALENERALLQKESPTDPVRLALRSNIDSLMREQAGQLNVELEVANPLVRTSDNQLRLVFANNGATTVKVGNILAIGSGKSRKAEQVDFMIGPGERHAVFIRLKPNDLKNDPFLRVEWTYRTEGQTVNGSRSWKPAYAEARSIHISPETILSVDPVAGVDVAINNTDSATHEYVIKAKSEAWSPTESPRLTIESGATRHYTVMIPGEGTPRQQVEISVLEDDKIVERRKLSADFLAAGSSVLRDTRVELLTSGTAAGFNAKFLRDGETYISGRLPQENSWKSINRMGAHQITARFPQPIFIHEIKLHWGADARQPHPSSALIIKARLENDQLVSLAHVLPRKDESVTSIAFSPIKAKEIIFIQPPLSGPEINPQAMWLTEIEVF